MNNENQEYINFLESLISQIKRGDVDIDDVFTDAMLDEYLASKSSVGTPPMIKYGDETQKP